MLLLMWLFLFQPVLAQASMLARLPCERTGLGACCCCVQAEAQATPSCCSATKQLPARGSEGRESLTQSSCDCLRKAAAPERLAALLDGPTDPLRLLEAWAPTRGLEAWQPAIRWTSAHGDLMLPHRGGGGDPPLSVHGARPEQVSRAARLLLHSGTRGLLADLSTWRS